MWSSFVFLISSILLFRKQRNYKETIKDKLKTILVPYFIWNTFWILVFVILQNFTVTSKFFSAGKTLIMQSSCIEWLEMYGIGIGMPYPKNYPLWFLRDLMVMMLIYPIIAYIADKTPKLLFTVACILLLVPIGFPFKAAILWFCIGACLVKMQVHCTDVDRIPVWCVCVVYICATVITLLLNNKVVDALFIFVGIVFWVRISKCIYLSEKSKKVFVWMSKWIFLFMSHMSLRCRL